MMSKYSRVESRGHKNTLLATMVEFVALASLPLIVLVVQAMVCLMETLTMPYAKPPSISCQSHDF